MKYLLRSLALLYIYIVFSLVWFISPILKTFIYLWNLDSHIFKHKFIDFNDKFEIHREHMTGMRYKYRSDKDYILDEKTYLTKEEYA